MVPRPKISHTTAVIYVTQILRWLLLLFGWLYCGFNYQSTSHFLRLSCEQWCCDAYALRMAQISLLQSFDIVISLNQFLEPVLHWKAIKKAVCSQRQDIWGSPTPPSSYWTACPYLWRDVHNDLCGCWIYLIRKLNLHDHRANTWFHLGTLWVCLLEMWVLIIFFALADYIRSE